MALALHFGAGMFGRHRVSLGQSGENLACRELARRGYEILARRYRTRAGEIDIVARQAGVLVFVEVKTRSGTRFGTGAQAVTRRKQGRIVAMAEDYLARKRLFGCSCRFDVVAISFEGGKRRVTIVPRAFDASGACEGFR